MEPNPSPTKMENNEGRKRSLSKSLNSISFIWYGLLIGTLQAFIIIQNVKRFVAFADFPWPLNSTPYIELNAYIILTGIAVLLFPFYLASCFINFGSLLSIPTSALLHVISAFCLLLPQTLIEAVLIKHNVSQDSLWKTDLDFLFQSNGNLRSSVDSPTVGETLEEAETFKIFHTFSIRPEFFNYALALFIFSARYSHSFWAQSRKFSVLFSLQSMLNTVHTLMTFSAFSLMYKLHIKGFSSSFPFLLDAQITLLLYIISAAIIFFSSCVLFHYGHLKVAQLKRSPSKGKANGLKYFPHCSAFAVLISLSLSQSPLIHDAFVLYQISLNPIVFYYVGGCGVHSLIWISLWFYLSLGKVPFKGETSEPSDLNKEYSYTPMERVEEGLIPQQQKAAPNLYSDKMYDLPSLRNSIEDPKGGSNQPKGCLRKCTRSQSFNVRFDDGEYALLARRAKERYQSQGARNDLLSFQNDQGGETTENDTDLPMSSPSADSGCQSGGSLTHSESSGNVNLLPSPYDTLPIPQCQRKEPIYGTRASFHSPNPPPPQQQIYDTNSLYEILAKRSSQVGSVYGVTTEPIYGSRGSNSPAKFQNQTPPCNFQLESKSLISPSFIQTQSPVSREILSPLANSLVNQQQQLTPKKHVEFVETPMPSLPPPLPPLQFLQARSPCSPPSQNQLSATGDSSWYHLVPKNQMFTSPIPLGQTIIPLPPSFFDVNDTSGDC